MRSASGGAWVERMRMKDRFWRMEKVNRLLWCPILFDLGETIPLIGHLSKLFPITWYLEFWG